MYTIYNLDLPKIQSHEYPDSKVHGANMGPTSALSVPDGPHVDPMKIVIGVGHKMLKPSAAPYIHYEEYHYGEKHELMYFPSHGPFFIVA